jgi:O-antigen/teichoic acid export membrane protein
MHLRQSSPIGLSELAWAALWYSATVLLGLWVVGEQLGWFGAAHRVVMALHTFVWLYFYNLLPTITRATQQPPARLEKLLSQSLALTAWCGIFAALAPALVAEDLLQAAFGARYDGAAGPLVVLLWVVPVALVSGHYRYFLIADNRQGLECASTAIAAAIAVGLGALLIPGYGAVGAAWSLLLANIVNCGVALACARWRTDVPFFRPLRLPCLAAALSAACYAVLAPQGAWQAASIAAVVYLVLFAAWAYVRFRLVLTPRPAVLLANHTPASLNPVSETCP